MAKDLKKAPRGDGGKESPKRLAPSPEVLRELYLLSGNNCAMPDCDNLIVDGKGVVVGHVCHLRAAKPGGARFDNSMTNEDRRAVSNLVLMCGGHHKQIDSKQYEAEYPVERVAQIKRDHEAKFKGIGSSLRKAFQTEYADVTDKLNPSIAGSFGRLEQALPDCRLTDEEALPRKKEVAAYIKLISKVPDAERRFMLAAIKRAIKLQQHDRILVHVDDVMSALGVSGAKLKALGSALDRYGVGDLDLYGVGDRDEYHVMIRDPSDYLSWFDVDRFCRKTGAKLDDFVLDLKFGLLD